MFGISLAQSPTLLRPSLDILINIMSLAFSSPSSLISASSDQSVKFWKIGAKPTDLVGTDSKSISIASATIMSITLQVKDGNLFITSDSDGVVRTCDIFTGLCKASFQTPAKGAD
jgi:WD40 repeat protein